MIFANNVRSSEIRLFLENLGMFATNEKKTFVISLTLTFYA